MKKAFKAALLSGLAFPGCGQFYLKRYVRGTALTFATLGCLMVIVLKLTQQALAILQEIDLGGGVNNMDAVSRALQKASSLSAGPAVTAAFVLLILFWVVGIVDAYLVGRRMDHEQREENRKPQVD